MENKNLNGWIPVADKLPEPLETVWITDGQNYATLGCRVIDDGEYYWATTNGIIYVENKSIQSECEWDNVDDVKYWQPLPELPKI
jgi:hypothetical protein